MNEVLEKRLKWLEVKAKELKLDYFPINWEVVPEEVIREVAVYGLPTRARHHSYGQAYDYQKISGEMGSSKIYEVILNNNPSYAFLLETNCDTDNSLVLAHCLGHSHFFKNNYLFKDSDRNMVQHAAERAQRIDDYITKYGIEEVEHIMDIALALEKHIDWDKGIYRKHYAAKQKILKKRNIGEFEDLQGLDLSAYQEFTLNENFPPHKEYDLLWFFANYADLESWQRDILEIIREESFYFYPQYLTKISNEGFASLIHAEMLYLMDEDHLSSQEHLDFCKTHERVVQPGHNKLNINPYFLGFTILGDIRKKWNKLYENGESSIDGWTKVLEVVANEDDISILRNYLTQDLINELEMFTYKNVYDRNTDHYIEIESRDVRDVVESQVRGLYNYHSPLIYIEKASSDGIELVHGSTEFGTLDLKHIEKVLGYVHQLWGGIINLETIDEKGGPINFTYDEERFLTSSR